jgi:NADH-quinone oxidoreductase subunit M
MIAHGFSAGAMFLGFGMLYERMHTRLIKDFGGIANVMPALAACFLVFCLSNVGLPGTAGFVGEFMVILGTFKASSWIACFAAMTVIVSASYTLWMYKRVFQGDVINEKVQALSGHDMNGIEWLICGLLIFTVFALGLYPQPLLTTLHATTGHLLGLATQVKV